MDYIGRTTIHPVLFYTGKISGYLTWAIMLLLFLNVDVVSRFSFIVNDYISFACLLVGLVLVFLSLRTLGRSTRLGLPLEDTALKTSGLYGVSRNPMYLGFNLLTIASMLYSLHILVAVLGAYSMVIYHMIILGEERFLENRFGSTYTKYKEDVRRYL